MMKCVSPECEPFDRLMVMRKKRVVYVPKPKKGERAWTPCCRNIRWYDEKGTLQGSRTDSVFCPECGRCVGRIEVEPILKGAKRPVVWHSHCSSERERSCNLKAHQWIDSAEREIGAMSRTIAYYAARRKGKKGADEAEIESALRKAILHLAKKLPKTGNTKLHDIATEVVLGREGKFGIKRYPSPAELSRKRSSALTK